MNFEKVFDEKLVYNIYSGSTHTALWWLPLQCSVRISEAREGIEEMSSLSPTLAANMPNNHHHYSLSLVCHSSSQFTATQNTSPRTKTVCLLNIIIVGCYSHSATTHAWRLVDHGKDPRSVHASLTLGLALLADYQHRYDDESKGTRSLHPDCTQLHSLSAQIVSQLYPTACLDPTLRP